MIEQLLISLENVFRDSPFLGLGASYLAGVLVSFSPCIYPLIPITLGIVGTESASTRRKALTISLVFVLGVACIYTLLGVVSALAGVFMGRLLVHPVTYLLLAVVFLGLGIALFFNLPVNIPFFSFNYERGTRKDLYSVFALGVVSGMAIIPCAFPVLGAILTLISLKRNALYGGVALFLFSFGYGTILIALGTFTSLVRKLPRQGRWLGFIKRVLALGLLGMGVYFASKGVRLVL